MTEKITREEIELILQAAETHIKAGLPHSSIDPGTVSALCTLALQAEAMREALIETAASLSAAHSLLSRGGKRAAPSNKMFAVMLEDYRKSLDRAVATLSSLPEPRR